MPYNELEEQARIRARCDELGIHLVRVMHESFAFPQHWFNPVGAWLKEQQDAKATS